MGSAVVLRSVPGVRPGGRHTFLGAQERRQTDFPCRVALPGRAQLTSLRSVKTGDAKPVLEGAARRPTKPALLACAEGKPRNTRIGLGKRAHLCQHLPSSNQERTACKRHCVFLEIEIGTDEAIGEVKRQMNQVRYLLSQCLVTALLVGMHRFVLMSTKRRVA